MQQKESTMTGSKLDKKTVEEAVYYREATTARAMALLALWKTVQADTLTEGLQRIPLCLYSRINPTKKMMRYYADKEYLWGENSYDTFNLYTEGQPITNNGKEIGLLLGRSAVPLTDIKEYMIRAGYKEHYRYLPAVGDNEVCLTGTVRWHDPDSAGVIIQGKKIVPLGENVAIDSRGISTIRTTREWRVRTTR